MIYRTRDNTLRVETHQPGVRHHRGLLAQLSWTSRSRTPRDEESRGCFLGGVGPEDGEVRKTSLHSRSILLFGRTGRCSLAGLLLRQYMGQQSATGKPLRASSSSHFFVDTSPWVSRRCFSSPAYMYISRLIRGHSNAGSVTS